MSGSINEKIVPKVGRKFDPLEALKIVSQDVQVYRRIAPGPSDNDKDGTLPLAYCRPTSKAFMAKKGFLMTETLGSGTYSKVKKAYKYNLKLDPEKLRASKPAKVAVKIIDMNRSPEDYKKKFLPRELGIWPRLNHPYICPLLDTFPVRMTACPKTACPNTDYGTVIGRPSLGTQLINWPNFTK